MEYFLNISNNIDEYNALSDYISVGGQLPALVTGLSHINKAHFISSLIEEKKRTPFLVITETEGAAQRLTDDINTMLGRNGALLYPAKDMTLGNVEAVSREYEHKRLDALRKLIDGECQAIIASPEATAQLTIPRCELEKRTILIKQGDDIDPAELTAKLIAAGFSRCDMVEGLSQFSVRGGIFDIFPINSSFPVRIELWGDSVDSISAFDLETQRRIDTIHEIKIAPAMEVLFDSPEILVERINDITAKLRGKKADDTKKLLNSDCERISAGLNIAGYDRYFPLAYEKPATVFDYVESAIICENVPTTENMRGVFSQHTEDLKILFEEGTLCKGLDRFMLSKSEYAELLTEKLIAYFDTFMRGGDIKLGLMLNVNGIQTSPWGGEYKVLEDELRSLVNRGYCCLIFAGTEKGARTIAADLRDDGFAADFSTNPKKLLAKKIYVVQGTLSAGFDYPNAKCAVFTHTAVHQTKKKPPKRKKGEEIRSLTDISVGDLVVHYAHGIGIFDGVQKITTQGISKDYIKIRYAGADALYVPVTQLDLVSRYIGSADASTIKLNKLNSEQWVKAKSKAKAAAKEMAGELIELYSRRMKSKGHAFPEDDDWQEKFEQHFSYVETDSQVRCIDEIKGDMQKGMPMERLLCGDVGFGKTEVALRAAFKCISGGKQCALLAPTTVLAWQHFQTTQKRMDGFPIKIELLSRYRSAKEVKAILKGLEDGTIDMIIGTHRIVQDDIKFKDLGLVIIDEEQRFGVAHKEKFKEMFSGVDILTLSATPIPRTLNMAMSGIRDMSVIDEPPQDRQPITTYVLEHDWGTIAQAINKELRRNGQVYYIHNRIESIYQCAAKIQELCPDASIGVAHGRMGEDQMLEVWRRLLDGELDILVCTTIIETGVDVPNCNTLIIENADYMGLAQLHQLRGRVGRTNRRAFAYFTFKRGKVLSEIATKRLNAIREFTQFGSGFRIALRDLEIRGAGSILGANQSGHLENVGYDMYLQLLDEAVKEQQGVEKPHKDECLVDVKIDAFIPETYISNQSQRIDCYRRIALIQTDDDGLDVTDELIDRYGDPPKSVLGLIEVAQLRNMASKAEITEITQHDENMFFFISKPNMSKIANVSEKFGRRMLLNLNDRQNIRITLLKNDKPLAVMRSVLEALQ